MPPRLIKVSRYGKTEDEQKASIYHSIKKFNLDFKQIMKKFKVSRACAFNYIKKCNSISSAQDCCEWANSDEYSAEKIVQNVASRCALDLRGEEMSKVLGKGAISPRNWEHRTCLCAQLIQGL